MCYAKRYHSILETGDASSLVTLSAGTRRHAMEALIALSKHLGCYDRWQQIRKQYNLKWSTGNESLQSLERFFNDSLDNMLSKVKEMIRLLSPLWPKWSNSAYLLALDLQKQSSLLGWFEQTYSNTTTQNVKP
jgi:hypothetical protein